MDIEVIPASAAPEALNESRHVGRNPVWDMVAEKLLDAKRGDWLRVPIAQVSGKNTVNKQANLASAMRKRKLPVTCRALGAHLWFRVKQEKKPTI